jgi:hypothetical protein
LLRGPGSPWSAKTVSAADRPRRRGPFDQQGWPSRAVRLFLLIRRRRGHA